MSGPTPRHGLTWPLWSSAAALVPTGLALGWLCASALHVIYPRVAGDRWWLAALAIPAGLGAGAMVWSGIALAVRARHPACSAWWVRSAMACVALTALPGVVLATRWGWIAGTAGDPFAGGWDTAWPLPLLLAPLGALVPLVLARVLCAPAEPVPAPGAPRAVRIVAVVLAAGWSWSVVGPVITSGPSFTIAHNRWRLPGHPPRDLAATLDDAAFERSYAGRLLRLRYGHVSALFWNAVPLWPESAQVELAIAEPAPWTTVAALTALAEEHAAARAELLAICADPTYDVDARLFALQGLDTQTAHRDEWIPVLRELIRDPAIAPDGLADHLPLAGYFASARSAPALLADYQRALRESAQDTLTSLTARQ